MNKKTQSILFSSKKPDHETPNDLFDQLNNEFAFTHDVAASASNHFCVNYLSEEVSAFDHAWGASNWCNPPYGRGVIEWINQAQEQSVFDRATVMLLPARTDTKWFFKALESANEIRFIKGRLKFKVQKDSAPFPSMLVIWYGKGQVTLNETPTEPYTWWKVILSSFK